MKKIFNWIKKNRSKIFVIFAILVIAMNIIPTDDIIFNNNVFAQINQVDNKQEANTDIGDQLISLLLNTATGILGGPIALLVNCFVVIIFIVLYSVFQFMGVSANGISFPFPDQIIFNKLAFFDPNFINPPTTAAGESVVGAPVAIMQELIQQMYYSFFILAGTIFVIAAMVIGIKLAFSTLAAQKAQYKAALTNWFMGILLLFTIHFLMAGMFYVNEKIVEAAYTVSVNSNIEFTVDSAEAISAVIGGTAGAVTSGGLATGIGGGLGRTIGSLITWLGQTITGNEDWGEWHLSGYSGYIITLIINAATGDLISSIICAIILGQTVSLVITYTRRLFYCIILGMMAPIIVAVDVIRRSIA